MGETLGGAERERLYGSAAPPAGGGGEDMRVQLVLVELLTRCWQDLTRLDHELQKGLSYLCDVQEVALLIVQIKKRKKSYSQSARLYSTLR